MISALTEAYSAAGELPRGSFVVGGLVFSWLVNRWLTDRALNNYTASDEYDWPKEVIVVTGGSGGIGAEIVKSLAVKGSQVVVLDVIPLTYPKPGNVHHYKCDLTNFDQLQAVAARVKKEVGAPTVAIANAGICRGKPILDASKRDIELTFAVNNLAVLWTAKTFLPDMVANNHGHFLIMASQTGYVATPGLTDYSATKAAAVAIYEGLHAEVHHVHKASMVRVSCVSPGLVDTKMFTGVNAAGAGITALRPEDLGSRVAGIIHGRRARHVMVPKSAALSTWTRALPDWMRVAMQRLTLGIFDELKPHNPMKA